jgi:hypothetical protein
MTTDPDMPSLIEDIPSDSSSEESFTDDENETMPELVSDHADDTDEDESARTSSDEVSVSITLKEANSDNINSQCNSNLCASPVKSRLA